MTQPPQPLQYATPSRSKGCLDGAELVLFGAFGFVYGLILGVLSFLCAGAGHGAYVLMGACSAPLALTQNVPIALFGIPVLWCAIGSLLAAVRRRGGRIAFVVVMLTHYASQLLILQHGDFADWDYVKKVQQPFDLGARIYLLGQLAIWITFAVIVSRAHRCR